MKSEIQNTACCVSGKSYLAHVAGTPDLKNTRENNQKQFVFPINSCSPGSHECVVYE